MAGCLGGTEFDRQEWLAAGNGCGDDSPRQEMIGDLTDNQLRTRMTRSDVLALLGEPSYRDGDTVVYGVGLRGSCEFLYLQFDSNGSLESWNRQES